MAERIERLEKSIDLAIEKAPLEMRAVIESLQALRGVAKITAVSIVAEVGSLSRFDQPRKLMATAAWSRANTPAAIASSEGTSPKRVTPTCGG